MKLRSLIFLQSMVNEHRVYCHSVATLAFGNYEIWLVCACDFN